ncbi:MAG: urocanate hydratase, partial [Acidimicrobiaceae bacterium]|nr:urocanate hydratase [Acidimicrobiaceae bacterium]
MTVTAPHTAGAPAGGVRAPTGSALTCRGWPQEAAFRMLQNNLDPDVAERPDDLVVYGGTGRAARSWGAYHAMIRALTDLAGDETLLVQSGKPVGVLRTHEWAPRVLIANSNLVPEWGTWDEFRRLEHLGLTMFGQMTAGSWIYIGTQGILQGTYECFAAIARKRFGGSLAGTLTVTAGLGGMGGAQPLAITMNDGVALCIEVDPVRAARRVETRYLDVVADDYADALRRCMEARRARRPLSVGLVGNAADIVPRLLADGVAADIVTDQTSAQDPLTYVPNDLTPEAAGEMGRSQPDELIRRARAAMAAHVDAMVGFLDAGAEVFDYGNSLRAEAVLGGCERAFDYPGFLPAYIRPLFCEGKGPFRWVALSGDAADIAATDRAVLEEFPEDEGLKRWINLAGERVAFQGLPARICWLGYGERHRLGLRFNEMVRSGELSAPIVIGRDHLDSGSVASPYRETEDMLDGSDAIADWPLL